MLIILSVEKYTYRNTVQNTKIQKYTSEIQCVHIGGKIYKQYIKYLVGTTVKYY